MFNYLKWELKEYFYSKYKWFIFLIASVVLFLVVPESVGGLLYGLVSLLILIALFAAVIGSYLAGTKHIVDTFSKRTFLLESMIPIPAKQILLIKYLLGIIINILYTVLLIAMFIAFAIKGAGLEVTVDLLKEIVDIADFASVAKAIICLICMSVAFLSVVVLAFVGVKAFRPNSKHDKILGFVVAIVLIYIVSYILSEIIGSSSSYIAVDLTYLITATISFFITAHLIENKLEIY